MYSLQTSVSPNRHDVESSRRTESPRDLRFRYGYICRLIDDDDLKGLPPALRSRARSRHKAAYWKSLSLLRRDAEYILNARRGRMAAERNWDYPLLLNDYARVHLLLAKLTLAGMNHSLHLAAGLEGARQACQDFERFLATSASSTHAVTA